MQPLYKSKTVIRNYQNLCYYYGMFTLTTKQLVTTAVLVAITIIMGVIPNIGFIPLPNLSAHATIEHIPTILGSIIEGPLVGIITGFSFGILSFTQATIPAFKDPLVAIVPRMLIGITPWLVFMLLKNVQRDVAAGVAGFAGAATNTVFVLGFAIARSYFPSAIVFAVLPQAIIEAIIASILTIMLSRALFIITQKLTSAPDNKDRKDMTY
jgi:uncharacterized membrane protein